MNPHNQPKDFADDSVAAKNTEARSYSDEDIRASIRKSIYTQKRKLQESMIAHEKALKSMFVDSLFTKLNLTRFR